MLFRYQLFSIIWAVIILVLSVAPAQSFPSVEFELISVDKLVHAVIYMVFSFFLIIGFLKQHAYRSLRHRAISVSMLIAAGYGLLMELVQAVLPDRYFGLDDLAANTIGAVLGGAAFLVVYRL